MLAILNLRILRLILTGDLPSGWFLPWVKWDSMRGSTCLFRLQCIAEGDTVCAIGFCLEKKNVYNRWGKWNNFERLPPLPVIFEWRECIEDREHFVLPSSHCIKFSRLGLVVQDWESTNWSCVLSMPCCKKVSSIHVYTESLGYAEGMSQFNQVTAAKMLSEHADSTGCSLAVLMARVLSIIMHQSILFFNVLKWIYIYLVEVHAIRY